MNYNTKTIENTTINHYQTKQFKSNKIRISFVAPLDIETATLRALVPYIMKAGSKRYSNRNEVSKALQDMYSAKFNIGVSKKGESHIIVFDISMIDDQYTLFNENLFKDSLSFIKDIIFNPLLEEDTFNQECRLMKEYYQSIYASKMRYTIQELNEKMFEHESYRIDALGSLEQLEKITYQDIFKTYKDMITKDEVTVTYIGNDSEEAVTKLLLETFVPNKSTYNVDLMEYASKEVKEVTVHEITQDVAQAKLVIGYRFPVYYKQDEYYNALIFEMLFGGTSESLLFKSLREDLGLVYSVQSSYNPYKGVFFIYAGINKESYSKVLETIEILFNKVKQGDISEELLEITKKQYTNSLIQSYDSISGLAYKVEHSSMYDIELNKDKTIESINKVTINDMANLVDKLTLDTICFLKGDDNE